MHALPRHILLLILTTLIVSGCGSGSSSSPSKYKTKVTTKVAAAQAFSTYSSLVLSLDLALAVPDGVTVSMDPVTNQPAQSVVTVVGSTNSLLIIKALDFIPATTTAKGTLLIRCANGDGFKPFNSLNVELEYPNNLTINLNDFKLTKFDYTTINAQKTTNSISLPQVEMDKLIKVIP